MTETNDTAQPTFSLRSLLVATALIAIFIAWSVDRTQLLKKHMQLQSRLAGKEKLEDPLERQFMTPAVVGKQLKDIPLLKILADETITSSDKNFYGAANYVTAPNVLENTANCQISGSTWMSLERHVPRASRLTSVSW